MHQYTVKELKKQIADMPDDMIVTMERVEDNYFNNYGWKTEIHKFGPDEPGVEEVEYFNAFGVVKLKTKNILVICGHH